MPLLTNIGCLAACRMEGGQSEIHALPAAALVWEGDRIVWLGREAQLPAALATMERWDGEGRLVVPGLIDCHTHLAFGGWRADEHEARLRGQSYLEIARAGGGIARTVRQTRSQSEAELVERASLFLQRCARLGVTTMECKSGYGLCLDQELKLLRVYQSLDRAQPLQLVPTFLGAHVVAPEFAQDRAGYVSLLCQELIPEVARRGLARFCDVFLEEGAFDLEEARSILQTGQEHGLPAKLHADQLSDGGGARLASELGAISADHLEHASEQGMTAMAEAGVVAVSLPLATLYLGQTPMPARRWIERGVPVAVATDFNPGSAPSCHLQLAMLLACLMQRMTPAEVLKGVTAYAARALGLEGEVGSLEPGKRADFVIIDAPDVNHWLLHFRENRVLKTVVGGVEYPLFHVSPP
jgi:imidazolonepropionase